PWGQPSQGSPGQPPPGGGRRTGVIAAIIAVVVLVLAAGAVLTRLLVSDDDASTASGSSTSQAGEETAIDPTDDLEAPSLTIEPPSASVPTVSGTEDSGGLSQDAYVEVAIAYIEAVRAQDCATAERLASPLLTSSGRSVYCGDSYTREVLSDFDPSNPKVDLYEIIDTAQITFTWSGSTAFVSLSSSAGEPKVDVLAAY
ncbi:MAG: hypothetical protein ACRDO2_13525, partial [Nocardioidaceae bacterium]